MCWRYQIMLDSSRVWTRSTEQQIAPASYATVCFARTFIIHAQPRRNARRPDENKSVRRPDAAQVSSYVSMSQDPRRHEKFLMRSSRRDHTFNRREKWILVQTLVVIKGLISWLKRWAHELKKLVNKVSGSDSSQCKHTVLQYKTRAFIILLL